MNGQFLLSNVFNDLRMYRRNCRTLVVPHTIAAVLSLLPGSSPIAVLRRVITIRVAAINRFALGPLAHVVHELLEVIEPLIADHDASPSIAAVFLVFGVPAALLHVSPATVGSL